MKQISLALLLLAFILLISCQEKNNNSANSNAQPIIELKEQIDEYFSALNEIGKFNGVIYATKNNSDIIHKAYNLNSNKNSTTYVTTKSQFDIHSVSKLMAHYLIEQLELEGKVNKNQSINEFIPEFPNGKKITIEMLLKHTSGLPRSFEEVEGDEIDLTSAQIIEYAKKQALLFEPGTATQYSNVAYEIIYFIIQEIHKKTFAQCLSDKIFKPLGMLNSGAHFYLKDQNLRHLAKNHKKSNATIVQVENILPDELKTARIFSTASDLNIFLDHIKSPPYNNLLKNKSGVIEKSGGSDGIRVEVYTNLKNNYNFIFLANYEEVPFQKTVEDFAKILEGKPYEVPKELNRKATELPIEVLNKYVGSYTFADMENLELTFKIENKNLVIYQDGELISNLKAESENTFFDDPKEPESFEFTDNQNGNFNVIMGWKGVKLRGIKK